MTYSQLLFRNLTYFWRTHLAVVLGIVAATAAIAGALIVGDSVRDSLVRMSETRLGKIDDAVFGGRFFRQQLADDLLKGETDRNLHVAPAIMVTGTVEYRNPETSITSRAGGVSVYGLDERGWELLDHAEIKLPERGEAVLNRRVADQLSVSVGDSISLTLEIPASIPRDALLGERNETLTQLDLVVTAIAEDELGLAQLGMNPSQQLPPNIYIALSDLQQALGQEELVPSRRQPISRPARVNALFIGKIDDSNGPPAPELTQALQQHLTLNDLGLRLVEHPETKTFSLESEQMFLESSIAETALQTAHELGATVSPVLVYLVNEVWKPATPDRYSMYSVVAGIDQPLPPPFGPFEFVGEHLPLDEDGVYLNEWVAEDLGAAVGETVRIKYHVVGDRGDLPEEEYELTVAGIVRMTGPAVDRSYTPYVAGVTDAESYADWREPFPLKRDRITGRDDDYWTEYRTAPKLFVSLETAQRLWKSRYGTLSTIRFAPPAGETSEEFARQFQEQFLAKVNLSTLGLAVQPVREIGIRAAQGTTDFTGLFIGFSFFLILSATILIGLLFRLGIEQRLREFGLFAALGFTPSRIRRMHLLEGAVLVIVGGLLGLLAAIGYAAIMIHGLKTWWSGAIGTKFLFLSIHPASLVTGWIIAAVVAGFAVFWGIRQTRNLTPRSLLAGGGMDFSSARNPWLSRFLFITCGGGALVLLLLTLAGVIPNVEAFGGFSWRVVMFFLIGIGTLTGALAGFATILGSGGLVQLAGPPTVGELKLGVKNAARNRSRSVMTVSLIASATFVIVAVAAGKMDPTGDIPRNQSGNGGFTLVAQTNVPVLYDLNSRTGRSKLGFNPQDEEQMALLDKARIVPFRMKPGENASCLNLYQTQLPTILGVPPDVLEMLNGEGRFQFADTPSPHPWQLLVESLPENRIPVLGDMNTLMYSLHKGVGATIELPEDLSHRGDLQVMGMFANSIFQGMLVMDEQNFHRLFPEQVGFQFFLIEVDPADAEAVSQLLESQLGDYGFDAEKISDRLADFLAVQNTYLSTFQTLGGLGLLLGTLGLATVMLRNVLERARELALLRAIGLRNGQIGRLVVWENLVLLGAGLLCGTVSALLAMSPHLMSSVAVVPWRSLVQLLGGVFVVGLLSVVVAVRAAVRMPILSTLRNE